MTIYDLALIVVLLISGIAGYARGGAKELVTLFAFLIAALVSALMLPWSGPLLRKLINPAWVGTVAAAVLVFVLAYIVVHGLGAWCRARLRQSEQLGGIDRILGLGVGLGRAVAMIGAFHLMMAAMTSSRIPHWFAGATLYPVSLWSAMCVKAVLPPLAQLADRIAPGVETSVRSGAGDSTAPSKGAAAYNRRQRQSMDALVERSR